MVEVIPSTFAPSWLSNDAVLTSASLIGSLNYENTNSLADPANNAHQGTTSPVPQKDLPTPSLLRFLFFRKMVYLPILLEEPWIIIGYHVSTTHVD